MVVVLTRWLGIGAALLAGLLAGAAPAAAVPCGTTDGATGDPVRGSLKLDERSVTTQAFKRSEDPRSLLLIYAVEGCELEGDLREPSIATLPRRGETDIPDGVLELRRVALDTREVAVQVSIDTDRFDPGSYGGMLEVRAPYLATTRTAVSLSRSEPTFIVPALIGAVVGLVAVGWFLALNAAGGRRVALGGHWLLIAGGAGAVAGGLAVLATWLDQDVWTFGENWLASAGIAMTGATTGAMAVLLRAITHDPVAERAAPQDGGPAAARTSTNPLADAPTPDAQPAERSGSVP